MPLKVSFYLKISYTLFCEVSVPIINAFLIALTLLAIQDVTLNILSKYMQYLSVRPSKVLRVNSTRCWCIMVEPWMTKGLPVNLPTVWGDGGILQNLIEKHRLVCVSAKITILNSVFKREVWKRCVRHI